MKYILAFDQGTTSSRSIIFDQLGQVVAIAQREFRQIFRQNGWVEHDPNAILKSQIETATEVLGKAKLTSRDIAAVGITNQRETTVIWDRVTGEPIHNAIVWQDRRTSEYCHHIRSEHGEVIRSLTGLEVDAYFSASKINWLLTNVPNARKRAEHGELAFGTVDTWLIWKLTGGKFHITDPSNASRTMLYDIRENKWEPRLLHIFDIPYMLLPSVRLSSELYCEIEEPRELFGVKIGGIAGDQQAALFGQGCFAVGNTKSTYGTGCFLLQNTGDKTVASKERLLTTVAWNINGKIEYALEGSVFIGGAVIQWLRDQLGVIETSEDVETLAASIPDNGDVYFVPAFVGLGTPHWDQDARGTIIGLTRGTGKAHIARAALESIAFQTADLLTAMNAESGFSLNELRVDGGVTSNEMLMQLQSDILQIPIVRSMVKETTALGAAYLAGLAEGFWSSKDELSEHWQADRRYEPGMSAREADRLLTRWHEAVSRSLAWDKKEREPNTTPVTQK